MEKAQASSLDISASLIQSALDKVTKQADTDKDPIVCSLVAIALCAQELAESTTALQPVIDILSVVKEKTAMLIAMHEKQHFGEDA